MSILLFIIIVSILIYFSYKTINIDKNSFPSLSLQSQKVKEKNKNKDKEDIYVLSLDGGGARIKVISSFLTYLENYLESKGKTIKNTFQIMGGTSSGALIISALSHTNKTTSEINDLFSKKYMEKMMQKNWTARVFDLFQFKPKYDGKSKSKIIQEVAGNLKVGDSKTKIIITGFDPKLEKPILFTSWDNPNVSIAEILDVTTAVPGYFPPTPNPVNGQMAIDGAFWALNPSMAIYTEIRKRYFNSRVHILSIGLSSNNNQKNIHQWGGIQWNGQIVGSLLEGSRKAVDLNLKKLTETNDDSYLRLKMNLSKKGLSTDTTDKKSIDNMNQYGKELWDMAKVHIHKFLSTDYSEEVEFSV